MSEERKIFDENVKRAESLVALYTVLKDEDKKDSPDYRLTDILRAATVLLHSSFEEYFRNILTKWLPVKAESNTLKQIPLSIYAGKHGDKIYLSDLAQYRNKSINEVICESVAEDLKLKSFNDEGAIRSWCTKIGIAILDAEKLKNINTAIQRRHKIVHEADMQLAGEGGKRRLAPIRPVDVNSWISAYKSIVNAIDTEIESWEEEYVQTNI